MALKEVSEVKHFKVKRDTENINEHRNSAIKEFKLIKESRQAKGKPIKNCSVLLHEEGLAFNKQQDSSGEQSKLELKDCKTVDDLRCLKVRKGLGVRGIRLYVKGIIFDFSTDILTKLESKESFKELLPNKFTDTLELSHYTSESEDVLLTSIEYFDHPAYEFNSYEVVTEGAAEYILKVFQGYTDFDEGSFLGVNEEQEVEANTEESENQSTTPKPDTQKAENQSTTSEVTPKGISAEDFASILDLEPPEIVSTTETEEPEENEDGSDSELNNKAYKGITSLVRGYIETELDEMPVGNQSTTSESSPIEVENQSTTSPVTCNLVSTDHCPLGGGILQRKVDALEESNAYLTAVVTRLLGGIPESLDDIKPLGELVLEQVSIILKEKDKRFDTAIELETGEDDEISEAEQYLILAFTEIDRLIGEGYRKGKAIAEVVEMAFDKSSEINRLMLAFQSKRKRSDADMVTVANLTEYYNYRYNRLIDDKGRKRAIRNPGADAKPKVRARSEW